ncbi:MAG TPA: MBL fold metallo-hydrolase [Pseudomonadales bacterium]
MTDASLEFYGAAGRVTGSCHILRFGKRTVLLDCGLIQGGREDESANADEFPFDPAAIDAVVLSHAHLDHSGRLPLLVRRGFRGRIHTHDATRALLRILLYDAADIEMSVVRRENRRRAERGEPLAAPLFLRDDVEDTLELVHGHRYDAWFEVVPGVRARLLDAGHIMGSAVVQLALGSGAESVSLTYSGDLGQYDSPILRDPVTPSGSDLVVMETTYGDRCHRDFAASLDELANVLEQAHRAGGNVLIPAFAVGRSQTLLYLLGKHFHDWRVDRWQIFLDSPLGIEASRIYWDFEHLFDEEAGELFRERDFMPKLPNLHFTRTGDESKLINRFKRGAIVIAGSGMCNGGRILHHFRRDLGRRGTHVVFTGFQPPGSLGRQIIEGAETIEIHGAPYPVRAKIHTIGGFSAHADQADLLRWYRGSGEAQPAPATYLVHGDPKALTGFQTHLARVAGVQAHVPRSGERVDLRRLPESGHGPVRS